MTGSIPWLIVKPPPDSFFRALTAHPERGSIDPVKALRQHYDFQETLEGLVDELIVMPKNELHPDSCFVQDAAIVIGNVALLGRSGIGVRKSEVPAVMNALKGVVEEIREIPPPGTFEGGDVLRVGRTLVVGKSRRTSSIGIDLLRNFASDMGYRVEVVDVPQGLVHLSTAASVIDDRLVIGLPEVLRHSAFRGLEQIPIGADPVQACNVLAIGDHIIASGEYPSHDVFERKGYILHRLDLSQFEKADGGPTCLALKQLGPA